MVRDLGRPVMIGLVLVVPFMILELINRQDLGTEFPFPLFLLMWLFGAAFVLMMTSVVRNLRSGGMNLAGIFRLMPRVAIVALIAWLWAGLVVDQMPCFLGVPNCD